MNDNKIEQELQRGIRGYLVMGVLFFILAVLLGLHFQDAFFKHMPIITDKIAQFKKIKATTATEIELKKYLISTSYAFLLSAIFIGHILSLWISSICVVFGYHYLCSFFFRKRLLKKLKEKTEIC